MKIETLLPLGKLDPGLREPDTPLNIAEFAERAAVAERVGLDAVLVEETKDDPFQLLALGATQTSTIGLGTSVAMAFPRSPTVTAMSAWSMSKVSNGRFVLGLGTQVRAHIERRYSAEFDHPGPRLADYVRALRAIFAAFQTGEPLRYDGDFFHHTLVPREWSPGPIDHPDIPIFVSAVGPWMLRMAGELADGIHVHPFHSRQYLDEVVLPKVAEGATRAGRDPTAVDLAIPVFTIVGDTEEEKAPWRDRARAQIAFYGSTRNYALQFDLLGFEGTSARLNDRLKAGDLRGMAELITDEMLDLYAVESTWDGLSDRLLDRYGDLARRLVFYFAELAHRRGGTTFDRLGEVADDLRRRTSGKPNRTDR